jgi:hypothetical protein
MIADVRSILPSGRSVLSFNPATDTVLHHIVHRLYLKSTLDSEL